MMLACDNNKCPVKWFQLSCVGLKAPPPPPRVAGYVQNAGTVTNYESLTLKYLKINPWQFSEPTLRKMGACTWVFTCEAFDFHLHNSFILHCCTTKIQ